MSPYIVVRQIQQHEHSQQDISHLAQLFDAYRQFYEQEANLQAAHEFISARISAGDSVVLIAELNGLPVGLCQLYPSFCSVIAAPIYILSDLYVQPSARKSGVARALMQYAEQVALRDGKARMDLTTAKTNANAQSLYESMGWKRDEVFFTYTRTPGAACSLTDYAANDYLD